MSWSSQRAEGSSRSLFDTFAKFLSGGCDLRRPIDQSAADPQDYSVRWLLAPPNRSGSRSIPPRDPGFHGDVVLSDPDPSVGLIDIVPTDGCDGGAGQRRDSGPDPAPGPDGPRRCRSAWDADGSRGQRGFVLGDLCVWARPGSGDKTRGPRSVGFFRRCGRPDEHRRADDRHRGRFFRDTRAVRAMEGREAAAVASRGLGCPRRAQERRGRTREAPGSAGDDSIRPVVRTLRVGRKGHRSRRSLAGPDGPGRDARVCGLALQPLAQRDGPARERGVDGHRAR